MKKIFAASLVAALIAAGCGRGKDSTLEPAAVAASPQQTAVENTAAASVHPPLLEVSPSFDCKYAVSRVHRLICSSPSLARADKTLVDAVRLAAAAGDGENLKAAQRAWVKDVRDVCPDEPCMLAAYEKRIAKLAK